MSEIPNHWALCPRVTTLLKQRALAIGRLEKAVALLALHHPAQSNFGDRDMNNITDRLLDSEEHAGDAAVPQVAYDAAEEIAALKLEIRRLTALVTAPPKQYQD